MKNVLRKLQEARLAVYNSDLKKSGRNDYSKFDYYTPEQVERLVDGACSKTNTIILCNLKADEFGLYQTLKFIDLDSLEEIDFEMRTKHGSITATNETQQMGGTDTYSERYIKMKVFQIKDNNLDIDSQDNRPKEVKQPVKKDEYQESVYSITIKSCKTLKDLQETWLTIPDTSKTKELTSLKDDLKTKLK